MNNDLKLKILLLGPVSSGKTTIANYLSSATENATGNWRPTKGVRIVEFVVREVRGKAIYKSNVEVELWDCSGDNRYNSCWPAFQNKTDGIIFVYTNAATQKADLKKLFSFFIEEMNFPKSNCLLIKNEFGSDTLINTSESPLPSINQISVNVEEKGIEFKKEFNSFVSTIIKSN